jgi:hypothetical protein
MSVENGIQDREGSTQRMIKYSSEPSEAPDIAVVNAIAKARGCDVSNMKPLYDVVDLDALNQLATEYSSADSDLQVSFSTDDMSVEILFKDQFTVLVSIR